MGGVVGGDLTGREIQDTESLLRRALRNVKDGERVFFWERSADARSERPVQPQPWERRES